MPVSPSYLLFSFGYFTLRKLNSEEKCDVTKIQIWEIMGFVKIFRQKKM